MTRVHTPAKSTFPFFFKRGVNCCLRSAANADTLYNIRIRSQIWGNKAAEQIVCRNNAEIFLEANDLFLRFAAPIKVMNRSSPDEGGLIQAIDNSEFKCEERRDQEA